MNVLGIYLIIQWINYNFSEYTHFLVNYIIIFVWIYLKNEWFYNILRVISYSRILQISRTHDEYHVCVNLWLS